MAQLWGTVALDLADSPLLPLGIYNTKSAYLLDRRSDGYCFTEYQDFTSLVSQRIGILERSEAASHIAQGDSQQFQNSLRQIKNSVVDFSAAIGTVQQVIFKQYAHKCNYWGMDTGGC